MGLSKLAIALTIIFIISITILLAELCYVLWRRRIFHRRNQNRSATVHCAAAETDGNSSQTSSKELLYFFCLNSKEIPRVDLPKSDPQDLNSVGSGQDDEIEEEEEIDVFKLQKNMYGPSKVLFTIKEEEFESDKSLHSSAEKGSSKRVRLEDLLKMKLAAGDITSQAEEVKIEVADVVGENEITTPFSTPCESPLCYFTPIASPVREL